MTPPDYLDRSLELALPQQLVGRRDQVLLVDEWIETGAQATAAARLVERPVAWGRARRRR